MTTVPPFVRVQENFEGSHAGEKKVFLYTPRGKKRTAVDVFVYTRKRLAKEIKDTLANAHKEDLPMLREFARIQHKEN